MLSRLFTAEGIKKRSVTAVSRQRFHFSLFISLSEYNIQFRLSPVHFPLYISQYPYSSPLEAGMHFWAASSDKYPVQTAP